PERRGRCEGVGGEMAAGGMLVCNQRRDVRGILDLGALVIASDMAGEEVVAVEDAHLLKISDEREHAAHMRVGNGIVVEIETNVRSFVRVHPLALDDGIGMIRQGQEPRRFRRMSDRQRTLNVYSERLARLCPSHSPLQWRRGGARSDRGGRTPAAGGGSRSG